MAKILTKNSFTSGSAPSGLSAGELAVNVVDRKIYVGNAVGGVVTLHDQQNVVTSVNGATGAITNVAVTNAAQTFSGLQSFSTGISASGATFTGPIFVQSEKISYAPDGFGTYNTSIFGSTAGRGNISISGGKNATTGQSNVSIGGNTLLTTGSNNVSIGGGQGITSGSNNTFVGSGSGYSIVSSNNVAIGSGALRWENGNTGYNISIGDGPKYRDYPFTGTSSRSIYIGHGITASSLNTTNEIVIGNLTTGIGDNKTVIGNSTTNETRLYGIISTSSGISASGATFSGNIYAPNIVTSINGTTGAITNVAVTNAAQTFSGLQSFSTGISAATILAQTVGGDEGGQIDFGNPATNTTLTGGVAIDIYQNKMRFFEKGGTARGYYIDLSAGGAGAGTDLVGGGAGAVTSVSGSGGGISVSPTTGAVVVSNTGVHSINGSTGAVTNVARINEGNTFTVRQVMNAGATMQSIYVSSGVTFASTTIELSNANPTINASNSIFNIKATQPVGNQPANVLLTLQAADIDTGGVPLATFKIQDPLGGVGQVHLDTNGTSGVVGITGAVSVKGTLSSTGLVSAAAGISATSGSTFSAATVYITNSTANVDPLFIQHSTTGALKVATTGQARIAYIKLGNASAPTSNTLIGQSDGVLTFYNGISNTGSNMISFSTSAINIPTTISGATFSGLLRSSSGISASAAITGGSHIFSESGFRVGSSSINAQTDSYSLQTTDDGKIITVNAGTVKSITVPTGLPVGFNCTVMRIGTGRVTFTASGTTINSVDGLLEIASQHGAASLLCYASNTFNLSGNLA